MKCHDLPDSGNRLLKADEVCTKLRITRRCLRRWTEQRKIPHYRTGKAAMYLQAAVEELIAKSRVEAVPQPTNEGGTEK